MFTMLVCHPHYYGSDCNIGRVSDVTVGLGCNKCYKTNLVLIYIGREQYSQG